MKLCDKILMLRKKMGLSQEELAAKLGVSRQAVSRWEVGSAQPDASNVLQLSRLFCVTADYLLNDECESDRDVPAVKSAEQNLKHKMYRMAGAVMAGLGLLGNFVIYVISRCVKVLAPLSYYDEANQCTMYLYDGQLRINYSYFLQEYRLHALVVILGILAAAGLALLLWNTPAVRQGVQKHFRKSPGELEYDSRQENREDSHT